MQTHPARETSRRRCCDDLQRTCAETMAALDGGSVYWEIEMGTVTKIGCISTLNRPPDDVLEDAIGKLTDVVVIGYRENGSEYFVSSMASGPDALWLIERTKKRVMAACD